MQYLQQSFSVRFEYKVFFTTHLFRSDNNLFRDFLLQSQQQGLTKKLLMVADAEVLRHHPELSTQLTMYMDRIPGVQLVPEIIIIPGGEQAKNTTIYLDRIVEAVNHYGIDRHSWLAAIGGGAVLDLAGYAAAISHRGIRHIRIPTTVLSQNDSGVGVKNGINYESKKNFLGTFAPPVAVFNDAHLLTTLSDADWRSGISEAIKVALIKDPVFFHWINEHATDLVQRDMPAMEYLIRRCAELHLQHIAGKDPFETGSSRPLDFGHWSAHKLEQLSDFTVRHGEAVAIGIALDSTYSWLDGRLSEQELQSILGLIKTLGLPLTHPFLEVQEGTSPILQGLQEFREHLGGRLTIMLLNTIGQGEEVHSLDTELIRQASDWVRDYDASTILSS